MGKNKKQNKPYKPTSKNVSPKNSNNNELESEACTEKFKRACYRCKIKNTCTRQF